MKSILSFLISLQALCQLIYAETPIEILATDAPGVILEIQYSPESYCKCNVFKVESSQIKFFTVTPEAVNADSWQDRYSLNSNRNLYSSAKNDVKEFMFVPGTNLVLSVFRNLNQFECIAHLFLVWELKEEKLILRKILDQGIWVGIGSARIDTIQYLGTDFGYIIAGFSSGGDGGEWWETLWFAQLKGTRFILLDQFHSGFVDSEKIERDESQVLGYAINLETMQARILWRTRKITTEIGQWQSRSTQLSLPKFILP